MSDPSEALGKQGWERCNCLNDYFGGWETLPTEALEPFAMTADYTGFVHEPETAEQGCQTPRMQSARTPTRMSARAT